MATTPMPRSGGPSAGPVPGWYSDPGTGRRRYWNGHEWAEYAPLPPTAPPAAAPVNTGTNGLAVASLVLSLLWGYGLLSVLAIIFGAMVRSQADESGQGGRGLATAGLIIGTVGAAIALLVMIAAAATAGLIIGIVGAAIALLLIIAAASPTTTGAGYRA